jgi:diguanylate cyclase (GGDEF)-like protein/PAS domain S-box-containing protein
VSLSSKRLDLEYLGHEHGVGHVERDVVDLQQVIEAGERLYLVVLSNLVLGMMAIYLIWDSTPAFGLAFWVGLLVVSILTRVLLMYRYRQVRIETLGRWKAYFIAASFFSGLVWGSYGLMFKVYGLDVYQGFEAFVLGGMAAGSISTSSSIKWNFPAFMVPVLATLAIYFVVQKEPTHFMMAGMIVLFMFLLSVLSMKFRRLESDRQSLLLLADRYIMRLRRSEQHMIDIGSSMGEGLFTLDPDGKVDYVNPTASEILGYPVEALLGMESASFIDVQTAGHPIKIAAKEGRKLQVSEDIFVRKDGQKVTVRYSVAPIDFDEHRSGVVCVFSDITIERRVQRMAEREHLLYLHGPIVVFDWIAKEGWPVEYVSSSITKWGYDQDELLQGDITFSSIVHEDDLQRIIDEANRYADLGAQDFEQYYRIKKRDGEIIWVYDYMAIHRDKNGVVTHFYGYLLDVTELKSSEILAKELADHDPLTGIYNRQRFDEEFLTEFTRMRRYGNALSLIMFDIDHFKDVNDTFGHLIGDSVLQEISSLVGKGLRSLDCFVRWGGEEFMVLLPETTLGAAVHVAEKMRQRISDHDFKGAGHITSSFGVVDVTRFADGESCLSAVDALLYQAKQNGRDRVEVDKDS